MTQVLGQLLIQGSLQHRLGQLLDRVAKQVPSSIPTCRSTPQPDTTTPSGSPDRKRSSILKAARDVFLAQGFQSASMETVAAEAGVSNLRYSPVTAS